MGNYEYEIVIKVNLKKVANLSFWLMAIAFCFGIIETAYFGFNFYPQTKAETICDNICLFIAGLGCILFAFAIIIRAKKLIEELF